MLYITIHSLSLSTAVRSRRSGRRARVRVGRGAGLSGPPHAPRCCVGPPGQGVHQIRRRDRRGVGWWVTIGDVRRLRRLPHERVLHAGGRGSRGLHHKMMIQVSLWEINGRHDGRDRVSMLHGEHNLPHTRLEQLEHCVLTGHCSAGAIDGEDFVSSLDPAVQEGSLVLHHFLHVHA